MITITLSYRPHFQLSQDAFFEAERCQSSNAVKSNQLFHVYGDLVALSLYETRLQGIMVVVFIKSTEYRSSRPKMAGDLRWDDKSLLKWWHYLLRPRMLQ